MSKQQSLFGVMCLVVGVKCHVVPEPLQLGRLGAHCHAICSACSASLVNSMPIL